MGAEGYSKADREKNGRIELLAFWAKSGYSPSGRLRDVDLDVFQEFIKAQRAIPEKERGYISFYENKSQEGSRAPTHRLVYQAPKAQPAAVSKPETGGDW
jgi:hypothetical protein